MAEKINIIVTPEAMAELKLAIERVKELEQFINKATSPSANNNYTASLKQQALETKNLTDAIIRNERAEQARIRTERASIALSEAKIRASKREQKEIDNTNKLAQAQARIDAKNSRTGASSVIPGMAGRISDLREVERLGVANERLSRSYVQLSNSREQAKNKLQDLIASQTASNAQVRQAQREFDVLNRRVQQADRAVGRFSQSNNSMGNSLRGVTNLMGAFGISTGLYLGASIVKNIYETTKQLQSLDLALKMVSGSQQEFGNNQGFLRGLAEQYGIEIKGLTKNFTEFWVASKGKLEAEQIKGIFTSISKSVAVMGLSVQQQDSAFLALQQMMSKGTVQAEELKKQLGNALPGAVKAATMAYQALHPEMKITEKYFMEQMKAGKVLSSELLPELAKAYEKLYGIENVKRAETLQAAQERLSNSWTDMVRSMNESKTGGISQFFSLVLDLATSTIKSLTELNDTWDILSKKSGQKGTEKGASLFSSFIKNAKAENKDMKSFVKDVKKESEDRLEVLKWQESELIDRIAKQAKKENGLIYRAGRISNLGIMTTPYDEMQKERVALIEKIKLEREIIKQAKDYKEVIKTPPATTKTKQQIDAERKAENDRLKAIEEATEKEFKIKLSNLEREKELIKDLRDNKDTSIEDMLFLDQAFAFKEIQIAQLNYDYQKTDLNKFLTEKENAISESQDRQLKATENFNKEELEKTKEWYKNNPPFFVETPEQKEEREKALKDKIEGLKAQLQAFRMFAGDFADNLGIGDTFDLLLNPDKDGNTLFEKLKADEATWKDYALAITTVMQDAYNFINQQSQARFEAEYSRLEEQKNIGLKNAGDSASAKEKIELDYEKKKKEIQKREAKAKKQQTLMNIALDTAQAVMSVLSTGGGTRYADFGISAGLLSGMVIAMGAAQAAMVIAQKIPEYWTGTDNAKDGLALTQERGAEIITDRKGKIKTFGSHKGAVLTRMQSGDKVFNAEESKRMMFENEYRLKATTTNTNNGMTADEMESIMVKTLGGRPTLNLNVDKNGLEMWHQKNGNITKQSESRGFGKGIEI